MGWVLWELRPLFLFFFLSLSFFVNSHALGYASSVLLVSCAFHFSFSIRLESCVPSFSVMTAEIPASQALWCTYTSHALHSPPSYKEVCATRMLREKCTGCQDLRLASNRAQLYTCVYFFLPVGCISVAPVRTRPADVLRLSASPCESAQLDVACFYGVPSCRIPPAEEWERNFWRARRRL